MFIGESCVDLNASHGQSLVVLRLYDDFLDFDLFLGEVLFDLTDIHVQRWVASEGVFLVVHYSVLYYRPCW